MPPIPSLTDPTDFDGCSLTNPLSFVVPATWDGDILGQSYFFPTSNTPNGTSTANLVDIFPSFADDGLDFSSHSIGGLPHELQTSSTPNALGLVKKLSPEPVAGCKTSSVLQSHDGGAEGHHRSGPTIQKVIATNETTLETLGTMLECSCSEDAYLLVIMSLIVFKVLAWYGAAARKPPSEHDIATTTTTTTSTTTTTTSATATAALPIASSRNNSIASSSTQSPQGATTPTSASRSKRQWNVVHQVPAVVKNYYLEGEDSGRMAAQLVLSELHRVQRVVSRLVAKMKALAVDEGRVEDDAPLLGGLLGGDEGVTLPYSGLILDQLGADMKQKLRTLSIGIVKGLSYSPT
ncbi:aflatoxin regulatory protein-domain-containing protein [Chaetomium sp. MPI-CAGE-AT-0009]|nr:aflatoxin regulatory protein-domain-containing protein [Chaetomium sp. MPI-CAGE-AT-0009]